MPDSSIKTLENMLDIAAYRQKLLTSNVANAETPGYKAKDISFQREMERAQSAPEGGGAMKSQSYDVQEPITTMPNRDGNTVNIDIEMAKVAENTLIYSTATQLMSMKFRMVKSVITGGR